MVSIFVSGTAFPQSPDIDIRLTLIPMPQNFSRLDGGVSLTQYSKIISDLPAEFEYILEQVKQKLQNIIKDSLRIERLETPREFKLPRKLRESAIDAQMQVNFDREGYYLWVDQDGICMQAPTVRGLFYATRTLFQLVVETGGMFWVPRCEIVDYPSLEIRGVSDENARGQAGSISSLKRYVEILSSFKLNMLQINLEDMFKSQKHPKSSDEERACFSYDEIQEIVLHSRQYFVYVCPIQSACGHMDNLFILPEYADLAEFPHASTCFDISNPKTLEYLKDIIEEEVEAWSASPHFHIACDESYDVGNGRSKEYVEEKGGKGPAYLEYYTKVYEIVKQALEKLHGPGKAHIYIYYDIMHKYQNILEQMPRESLIVNYWRYSTREKHADLRKIVNAGFNFVVTPSAMDWTRFYPSETRAEMNVINIANYACQEAESQGKREHFLGVITASWGDYLNPNPRDLRLYNYILCGDVAWNLDAWRSCTNSTRAKSRLPHFRRAFAKQFVGVDPDNFLIIQNLLRRVEDEKQLKIQWGSTSAFANLFLHPYQRRPRVRVTKFPEVITNMETVLHILEELNSSSSVDRSYLEHVALAARLVKLYAGKILHSRKVMSKKFEKYSQLKIEDLIVDITRMRDEFQAVKEQYARVWRLACKEAGLVVHLQNFDWIIRYYNEVLAAIQNGTQKSVDPSLPSEYIYFYPKRELGRPSLFRKNFQVSEQPTHVYIQCVPFQYAEISINGTRVGEVEKRYSPSYMANIHGIRIFDITQYVHIGDNCIAIKVISYTGGWPMINVYGEIYTTHGLDSILYSDKSWFAISQLEPPSDWQTCGLDVKEWKHVDTFGKPPLAMGALYYPDFERGLASHHTTDLGKLAENLTHARIWFGWIIRLVARLVNNLQWLC